MRTLQDLTPSEIETIMQESATRCYHTIATEHGVTITTIRRLVRIYSRQNEKEDVNKMHGLKN